PSSIGRCTRASRPPPSVLKWVLAPPRQITFPVHAATSSLHRKCRQTNRGLEVLDQVEPFPREEIAFRLAAEMAVGGRRAINRLVETQIGSNAARREAAELVDAADGLL